LINIVRTISDNQGFLQLVRSLDADLAERDGKSHLFYTQFNKIDKIKFVIVAYEHDQPVGCGALKYFTEDIMGMKRMYTSPECRGKGIATKVLTELETRSAE
jgi:putative acetyltransferase